MKYSEFIGIDVSKKTIDVALKSANQAIVQHHQFKNNNQGFKVVMKWLQKNTTIPKEKWLFCMEHTGVYALPLACFLAEQKLHFCLENPYHIKHSMGIQRGKTDKSDAKMIARYAAMHQEELRLAQVPAKLILKLKALLAYRDRLVNSYQVFKVPAGELAEFTDKDICGMVTKDTNSLLKVLGRRIKNIDEQIETVLKEDDVMAKNYQLATSVKGVGKVIAAHMIVYTQNFTTITDSRKFAAYSGIAPFPHSSGSSIQKGSAVSHLANKKMKSLLSNGAWSAARFDKELKVYFNRKTEEGKSTLSVVNAIKNKLVARVFAVIKRGTPYVEIMQYA